MFLKQMSSSSFHMFIYARSEQRDLCPIYTMTNTYQNLSRYTEIHPGQNFTGSRTFTWQTCQRKPNSIHVSYHGEFNRTPLFTRVQIRSVLRFVQLCCILTQVNAFTPWYKRVGAYLGNLMFINFFLRINFLSGLIPISIFRLNKSN